MTGEAMSAGDGTLHSQAALTMSVEYEPGLTDLEKAVAGFEAATAFMDLLDALGEDEGCEGKVTWKTDGMKFDGDDIGAQPIFDALVAAYNKGKAAALAPAGAGKP